jgi:tetratricopeptide (TPR) repeat protein/tRNA A-37 threonylcarbamoyl transferase component Bud32
MSTSHQREAALFDEALDLPPEERGAHLDQACGGDAELRRRVESLLQACESKCEFMDAPADPDAAAQTVDLSPAFEKPGDTIGRYKLLQQIGVGGCGVVYVAEQAEPVRRRVALKIIKLGMDTKSVIARFEAERQALAMMEHPNIAKVFDAGATETGRPYFVMELVRGMKITAYCDEAKLSTRARLDLFIQVCQAIQHAHQKGIIHRDIKPSNILVTVNDGVPVPKVIDFGVAKATSGQQLTDKTIYTAFEQFIGTPAYMSPEQAVLTSLDIDTRSDIYALGVLLYELLTGKTPFDAAELLAIGLDEMRRTIREQEPQRPSTRISTLPGKELSTTAQHRSIEAPKLVSELRGDLDWIVMKALEKDRARRYETANGLAADIQRHLNHEPVLACPPGRFYRLRKLARRNKLAFLAGSAVALSLIAGLTVSTVLFFRERAARQQAAEQGAVTESVNDFLLEDLLGQAASLSQAADGYRPNPKLTVREALERAERRIGNRFKDRPLQEAAVRKAIGDALCGIGQAARGVEQLQRAVKLRRTELGPDHRDTLNAMISLSRAYYGAGRHAEALSLLEEILKRARSALGPDDEDTATAMSDLARSYRHAGRFDKALPLYQETLRLNEAAWGPDHPDTLGSMNNLAMGYHRQGRLDLAMPLFQKAMTRMKATLGLHHPFTQNAMRGLADVYRDADRLEEALELYREVVRLRAETMGPGDPATLGEMDRLASTLVMARKYDEAAKVYREMLDRLRSDSGKEMPPEVPLLGFVLHHLADALRKLEMPNEARPFAEEAVVVYERHADWPTQESQHAFEVLKAVLQDLRDSTGSEAVRVKQMAALRAAADNDDLVALNNLAWILSTSSDPAHRDGKSAVKFAERAVELTSRKNPGMLGTLAAALAETGDFTKAADALREAISLCGNETDKAGFAAQLKLYESKTPYRDPDL